MCAYYAQDVLLRACMLRVRRNLVFIREEWSYRSLFVGTVTVLVNNYRLVDNK